MIKPVSRAQQRMARNFGVAARETIVEPSTESADMIRDYIKGLMDKQNEEEIVLKPVTDDEIEQSLLRFNVSTRSSPKARVPFGRQHCMFTRCTNLVTSPLIA